MAKIASDLDKPDGFFVLDHDNWLETVGEKPASLFRVWARRPSSACGRSASRRSAELAETDEQTLERAFGPNHGRGLRARANGIGSATLNEDTVRKSESRETTFPQDVTDRGVLHETVERLGRSVCREPRVRTSASGRTVTLKIRLRPFKTYTRSRTLPSHLRPGGRRGDGAGAARPLRPAGPVRLVGVGLAGLAEEAPDTSPASIKRFALRLTPHGAPSRSLARAGS